MARSERAPSGRGRCVICETTIGLGELRNINSRLKLTRAALASRPQSGS